MTGRSVLDEEKLPPIESFDSSLGVGSRISIDDYKHAEQVWNVFGCRTLRDYTNVYCELDVLLLAELFSQFKDNCKNVGELICLFVFIVTLFQQFNLYPEAYPTLPGFTYDACIFLLQRENIRIELLTDLEQIEFVERGVLILVGY